VLLLDDDRDIIKAVLQIIPELGHEVVISSNYLEGIAYWKSDKFDLIIVQITPVYEINCYPFYVLETEVKIKKRIRKIFESPIRSIKFWINTIQNMSLGEKIIMITKGKIWNVDKLAKQYGIYDHIQKPYQYFDNEYQDFEYEAFKERLTASVLRAFAVFEGINLTGIIGRDYKLRKAMNGLADASRTNFNIIITGEKGTGKKLFARKIHENSQFKNGPFIVVDCHSIQKLDRNLFTKNTVPNISTITNPGTILFHDINYMPIDVQIELYNYLHDPTNINIQDRQLSQSRPRIIASTSKIKEDLIEKGQFLEDLFNEISFFQLFLPPLRERSNDIPALAEHFVNIHNNGHTENFNYSISKELLSRLEAYNWSGNITEFINVINQTISNAPGGGPLTSVHLPEKIVTSTFKTGSRRSKSYVEKLLSETFKFYENKIEKPAIFKLEDYPWMFSDTNFTTISNEENKSIKSPPEGRAKKPLESPKDRATIKFYQSGDHWEIGPSDGTGSFDDLIGFRHLHFLLRYPDRRFTPEEVYNGDVETPTDAKKKFVLDAKTDDEEYEIIKRKSKNELIETLKELNTIEDSLSEDPSFGARRKELIYLTKKCLEDRKGFGDSDRAAKARINVTKSIRRAISKVNEKMPSFKKYFNKETIKTGNSIVYMPDPSNTPNWILFKPKT